MSAAAAGVPIQFSASIDVNNFFIPVSEGITLQSLSSNFPLTAFKIKTVPQKSFLFNITGSISGFNVASPGATSLSGSVQLIKRSGTDTILEEGIFVKQLVDSIEGGSGQFNFSSTSSLAFNDLVYLRVVGLKNGTTTIANPTAFTASINSFAITSTPTGSAKELVVEPYLTSPFYGTDCDVTYGNASKPVSNPFLQDIDYANGTITPVNNIAIISGSATKGTVPESYYTALSSINLKYNGSKNQSHYINEWVPIGSSINDNSSAGYPSSNTTTNFGDPYNIGNLGQTTPIESSIPFVIFFESFERTQGSGPLTGTSITEFKPTYIIDADLNLIEITNDPIIFEELKQIMTPLPRPLKEYGLYGKPSMETFRAISFSPSSSFVGGYTGVSNVFVNDPPTSDLRIKVYNDIDGSIYDLPSTAKDFAGLLFPTSLEYSKIPDLPSKAREVLTKNNIITPTDISS